MMTIIRKIDDTTFWLYAWADAHLEVKSVHFSRQATKNAAAKWRRAHR